MITRREKRPDAAPAPATKRSESRQKYRGGCTRSRENQEEDQIGTWTKGGYQPSEVLVNIQQKFSMGMYSPLQLFEQDYMKNSPAEYAGTIRSFIAVPEELYRNMVLLLLYTRTLPVHFPARGRRNPLYPVENMHEFGIAYDIFRTAQKTAQDHHARQVKRVCIDIGEMSMVSPEQYSSCSYPHRRRSSLTRGRPRDTEVPRRQSGCGHGSEKFICPGCGALSWWGRGSWSPISR